jgi:hypothetical protein
MAAGLPLAALTACAVVQSRVVDDTKATPDGVVYYMPRRPFLVTVTTPAATTAVPNPSSTVAIAQGTAEAHLKHRFVLSQGTNLVGKAEFNIAVGTNGLLKTSNSTATSEVTTALQNAVTSAGTLVGVATAPPGLHGANPLLVSAQIALPTNGCPPPGTSYQYPLYPEIVSLPGDPNAQLTNFCGYQVSWKLAAGGKTSYPPNQNFTDANPLGVSGIFYRHELPYDVSVIGPKDTNGNATVAVSVLTSPDESEIDFFPVKESFFASNDAKLTITDGVLTGVDQTTDGEVTAALGLPSTVLSNYTSAIGQIFGNLTTNVGDVQKLLAAQQSVLAAQQSLALSQAQIAVCRSTIAANPLAGLSAAQATTALSAISAACPSH